MSVLSITLALLIAVNGTIPYYNNAQEGYNYKDNTMVQIQCHTEDLVLGIPIDLEPHQEIGWGLNLHNTQPVQLECTVKATRRIRAISGLFGMIVGIQWQLQLQIQQDCKRRCIGGMPFEQSRVMPLPLTYYNSTNHRSLFMYQKERNT